MAHVPESDAEGDFLEGVYTTDIGLTWLASQWEVLEEFYRKYVQSHSDEGPAVVWLKIAESSVDEFDRSKAVQLGQDVQRLLRSPLTDETIRTVWLAATHGVFDPGEYGMSSRRLAAEGRRGMACPGAPERSRVRPPAAATRGGRGTSAGRPPGDPPGRGTTEPRSREPPFGTPVTGLVPALERVVTESCADLGYRLFLRAMKAYHVPADRPGLVALGERFDYPEWVVPEGLNDRTD